MFGLKNQKNGDENNRSPEAIRRRLGIVKDEQGLYWNLPIHAYTKYPTIGVLESKLAKKKSELVIACEFLPQQIAWDFGETNLETKFINTYRLSKEQLHILAYTVESPDVQLQMLRECGKGFQELVIKMSNNPNLSDKAIDYIVKMFLAKVRPVITKEGKHINPPIMGFTTEAKVFYENLLETENPNNDLVKQLSLILIENKDSLVYCIGGKDKLLRNKNISPEVLDIMIDEQFPVKYKSGIVFDKQLEDRILDQDKEYFQATLSHPNVSSETLLRFVQENQFLSEELSQDQSISAEEAFALRAKNHEYNLSIIPAITAVLKHPNSTPEITKIVLDQFNLLNVLQQMEYLKTGLIDGFYNNPNLGENPFTRLESLFRSEFTKFKRPEDQPIPIVYGKLDHLSLKNSLNSLYYSTRKIFEGDIFDNLIAKIVTEPKFPKVLQTEFFKLWLEENLKIQRYPENNFEGKVNDLVSDVYKIVNCTTELGNKSPFAKSLVDKNTSPEMLQLFFKRADDVLWALS